MFFASALSQKVAFLVRTMYAYYRALHCFYVDSGMCKHICNIQNIAIFEPLFDPEYCHTYIDKCLHIAGPDNARPSDHKAAGIKATDSEWDIVRAREKAARMSASRYLVRRALSSE